tara:strand:- start:116 stop:649 length:534 start_codon:yes stop_codon:yes gene_type:complete
MAEQQFLKSKTVWNTKNGNPCTAHESPLEPGVWHMPADSCDTEPPAFDIDTQMAVWDGTNWAIERKPIPGELDPEDDGDSIDPEYKDHRTWNPMLIMRQQRRALLEKTDIFLAVNDFPISDETRQAWQDYRQELRDLPDKYPNPQWDESQDGKLTNMVWPRNPDGYSEPDDIFKTMM